MKNWEDDFITNGKQGAIIMRRSRSSALGLAAAAAAALAAMPATADPVADFYRGKTMTLIIS